MIAIRIKVGDTRYDLAFDKASDTIVPSKRHIRRRIVPCLTYFTVASSGCLDYVGEKKIQILTTKVGGAFIMRVNTVLRNHCLEDVEWGLNQLTMKFEATCSVHSESLRSMLVFTTKT